MAKKIIWSKRAKGEFFQIATYLEEKISKQAADNFVDKVVKKIDWLSRFPTVGRKVPVRKTVRFILVGKHHRIYYRIVGQSIIISHIFDTRQHPDKDIHQ